MGFGKNFLGASSEQEPNNSVPENLKEIDVDAKKSMAEIIASTWNELDVEKLAPYLADDLQYNSVWISNTMKSKAEYIYYLERKFETIKKSGDIPIVDIVTENGTCYPSLSQKGTGVNSVIDIEEKNGKITKMLMRPNVKIAKVDVNEWDTYAKTYHEFLSMAMQIAGQSIQDYINERGFKFPDFTWIKADLMAYPSFHHISFRYGSQVYAILIAIHGFKTPDGNEDDRIVVSKREYENLIYESKKHNLIPCIIPIAARPQLPMIRNAHIINAVSEKTIVFGEPYPNGGVAMSEWEIYNMGINQVVNDLVKQGYKIHSYCDVLGIDPQIWFDKEGKTSYVVVRSIPIGLRDEDFVIHKDMLVKTSNYDGYFADLQFANEHNNGDFEDKMLWRGERFWCNYTGLQEIEKAIAEKSFIKVCKDEVYDIH